MFIHILSTRSAIHPFIYSSIQSSFHPFIRTPIHLSTNSFIHPFIDLTIHLFTRPRQPVESGIFLFSFTYLPEDLFINSSLHFPIYASIHQSIHQSSHSPISLYINLVIHPSVYPSTFSFIHQSIHQPSHSSVSLSIHLLIHPSCFNPSLHPSIPAQNKTMLLQWHQPIQLRSSSIAPCFITHPYHHLPLHPFVYVFL